MEKVEQPILSGREEEAKFDQPYESKLMSWKIWTSIAVAISIAVGFVISKYA